MKIDAYQTHVNTTIIGVHGIGNERGIWVPTAIKGGSFYIKATGFQQTGDAIVDIDRRYSRHDLGDRIAQATRP